MERNLRLQHAQSTRANSFTNFDLQLEHTNVIATLCIFGDSEYGDSV